MRGSIAPNARAEDAEGGIMDVGGWSQAVDRKEYIQPLFARKVETPLFANCFPTFSCPPPRMPICTTCTHPIPHLYTVYESAYNLRLEQCVRTMQPSLSPRHALRPSFFLFLFFLDRMSFVRRPIRRARYPNVGVRLNLTKERCLSPFVV